MEFLGDYAEFRRGKDKKPRKRRIQGAWNSYANSYAKNKAHGALHTAGLGATMGGAGYLLARGLGAKTGGAAAVGGLSGALGAVSAHTGRKVYQNKYKAWENAGRPGGAAPTSTLPASYWGNRRSKSQKLRANRK